MYGILRNEDLEEKRFSAFDGRTKRYICHWMFAYVAFHFIYAQFFPLCILPWRSPFFLPIFTRWCIIIAILRVSHICNHYQSTRMTVSFDTITGITHVYGLATLRADHRQPTDTVAVRYIALTRIRGEEAQSWLVDIGPSDRPNTIYGNMDESRVTVCSSSFLFLSYVIRV